MILIGKRQTLVVKRTVDFGVYLGEEGKEDVVLLPKKQVPETASIGSEISVFVYKDSEDRPIATVNEPYAEVGEFAYLKVKAVSRIGAFLDFGLEKDLFLPFKEQEAPLKVGNSVCVYVYLDKSSRIAATMKLYDHLSPDEEKEYEKGDAFEGFVYRQNKEVGTFIAVKEKTEEKDVQLKKLYFGLIPSAQSFGAEKIGDKVSGRIMRVRADGKLDLAVRQLAYKQMNTDGEAILKLIDEYDGELPFSESASPEIIKRELHMSKNAFKRALGGLLKEGKIIIFKDSVTRK